MKRPTATCRAGVQAMVVHGGMLFEALTAGIDEALTGNGQLGIFNTEITGNGMGINIKGEAFRDIAIKAVVDEVFGQLNKAIHFIKVDIKLIWIQA